MKTCSKCRKELIDDMFIDNNMIRKTCNICRDRKKNKLKSAPEGHKCCTTCMKNIPNENFEGKNKSCDQCIKNDRERKKRLMNREIKDNEKICSSCFQIRLKTEYKKESHTHCIVCYNKDKEYLANKLAEPIPEGYKKCIHCHRSKPNDQFVESRCLDCRNTRNKTRRDRRKNDPIYRISENVRCRTRSAIRNKTISTEELLGCSWEKLHKWLLYRLKIRYGIDELDPDKEYHIDHFLPLASFNLESEIEQKRACHWSNLEYLTAEDNNKKMDNIPTEEEQLEWADVYSHYVYYSTTTSSPTRSILT